MNRLLRWLLCRKEWHLVKVSYDNHGGFTMTCQACSFCVSWTKVHE